MKNNIWFFGDCFTWGHGCLSYEPYYSYKEPNDRIWTETVSKHFNMVEQKPFYGIGATMYIIVNFMRSLRDMKKGDIVVISDSEVKSLLTISRNKKNISSISGFPLENFDQWHDEQEKQVITSFVDYQIKPYEKIWEDFHIKLIEDLAYELKKRGINTLFWSHYQWKGNNLYETIKEATNGEIVDFHYSWKGHNQFANYIIKRIKNKEWIVDLI